MPKDDYSEIKNKLSTTKPVNWLTMGFLRRWLDADVKNAPIKKESLDGPHVGVDVTSGETRGAELSVNVNDILAKMPVIEITICINGSPATLTIPFVGQEAAE